jgi:hypothetical protein
LTALYGLSKTDWDREDLVSLVLPFGHIVRAGAEINEALRRFMAVLSNA